MSNRSKAIKPLFIDAEIQKKFEEDGYVKIPLLDEASVEELKAYYASLKHEHIGKYGFHVSLDSRDEHYIEGVFDKLFAVIMPKLSPHLQNSRAFTASYVIKEAGLQNVVPPHQDWSFVDEEQYCSATVWIPLMDVNKSNGALGVIKGSHQLFHAPRVSPSPQVKSALSDHLATLFPYVDVIAMKAGEALIFNNRTIHASPPNISGNTRIGVGIGITQKDAGLLHYYQLPGSDEIEVYSVDESFFKKYNNARFSDLYDAGMKPTELKKIRVLKKDTTTYTKQEIINLVTSVEGVSVKQELMNELANLYKPRTEATEKTVAAETPETEVVKEKEIVATEWVDPRSFFEKYTPANIIAEIKHRLKSK